MQKFLFLLLISPSILWSQIRTSVSPQLAYNEFSDQFFVLDDSTHYYTQKPGSKQWIKHTYSYQGDESFREVMNLTRVLPVNKDTYYFVEAGCGRVYELRKGIFKRVDISFSHRNQFGASMVAWKGSVFMFGGYGFFQDKNVFSRYVSSSKEWFEVIINGTNRPSPRSISLFLMKKNKLYILGGLHIDHINQTTLSDVWEYDFTKKTWLKKGNLNELLLANYNQSMLHSHTQNSVFRKANRLIELNIDENKWTSYENPYVLNMLQLVPSKQNKYILYSCTDSKRSFFEVKVRSLKSLQEFKVGEFPIYQKTSVLSEISKEDWLWLSLIFNFFLFTLLFYVRRLHKMTFLTRAQKKLRKVDFTESEWEVMCLIQQHGQMELSALNEYFNEAGLSYETLKKRRESFIKSIRIKIALITRKPMEEILIETKHHVDKRMKIIHWNEEITLEGGSDS